MEEFNSNDWQGRRKDQVEHSTWFAILALLALTICILAFAVFGK
jgi:hypothetical protein